MMTEEEAGKKWCPYSRTDYSDANCRASACMAWRWGMEFANGDFVTKYRRTPIKDSPGHSLNEPEGYCGLAGVQP